MEKRPRHTPRYATPHHLLRRPGTEFLIAPATPATPAATAAPSRLEELVDLRLIGGAEGTGVDGVRDAAFRRHGGAKAAFAKHPERIVGRASLTVQDGAGGGGGASEGLEGDIGFTGYAVSPPSSPHPSALDLSPRK